jgi:hypothetical protein
MRAGLQRILAALIGRSSAPTDGITLGVLPSMRRRRRLARSIEELLDAAGGGPGTSQIPHPRWDSLFLRGPVVWTCQVHLLAIKDALLDPRQPLAAQALQQLKRFLTDPSSPLCGTNPAVARRSAEQLQWSFTGRPEP